ncbi:MAG: hypothetical protein FWC51_03045 [Proteobacteria bacterium]|nr:hypothetical protein [Pseudomonadota bacterium]
MQNPNKRIIVLRYHDEFGLCLNQVRWLRKLNPGVKIVGMYGGTKAIPAPLIAALDGNYVSPFDARFNWMHCDLVLADWFRTVGHGYHFDILNLIEWDWLTLESLDAVYGAEPNTVYLADKQTFKDLTAGGWHWTTQKFEQRFRDQVAECEGFFGKLNWGDFCAGIFGGIQIPRAFLEKYATYTPQPLTNDEARMCLWAQAMGFKMADNGMEREPNFVTASGEYKNLDYAGFSDRVTRGAAAMHPVRTIALFKTLTGIKKRLRKISADD